MGIENPREIKRYKWEYGQFLDFVKERKPGRAMIYAKALGIDRRTLVLWMEQPDLRAALAESLDEMLDGMQRAGKEDWRMYREMLRLYGLADKQDVDVTSDGAPINVIVESPYDRKPSFRIDNQATEADEVAEASSE